MTRAMRMIARRVVPAVGLACIAAAGCGGGSKDVPSGVDGPVVFRDSLADNRHGWIEDPRVPHRAGRWEWNDLQSGGPRALPDALPATRVPASVSVGVDVTMREGAALRGVVCREHGTAEAFGGAYELAIDGRRALIRKVTADNPPRVLASNDLPVANGKRVRLVGRCIEDDEALALTLLVDGKVVAQARDADRGPNGAVGLTRSRVPTAPGRQA